MADFRCGRDICRRFYEEIIAPQLVGIEHDAALIGEGSDVLGYDQEISRDHNWGPRATVFVEGPEMPSLSLPEKFYGFSVKRDNVCVTTIEKWLDENLGISDIMNISPVKWLALPQQLLLQFVGGFKLGGNLGAYEKARKALEWYPDDVWRWLMAAQWYFIWSEERLIFRTRDAGDEMGAQMILHKLMRHVFQMYFLQRRRYQPYDKWFGTAFRTLPGHGFFEKRFMEAISSRPERQIELLREMLLRLGENHNQLGITRHIEPRYAPYEVGIDGAVRPYLIINSAEFTEALKEAVSDSALKEMPLVGGIDQAGNTTDIMINFSPWKEIFENGYKNCLEA